LEKRLVAKTRLLAEEKALEEKERQKQVRAWSVYKKTLMCVQVDQRIAELEAEIKARWIKFSDSKEKKIHLLKAFRSRFRLLNRFDDQPAWACQEVLATLQNDGHDISLLGEGRTGKLIQTLSLVTATPDDRLNLIAAELAKLQQEQVAAKNYWFFAERRQNQLVQRLAALKEFRNLLKPGYRVQEVLDILSAKKPEQFAALQNESKLLAQLKEIDQFMPNSVLGKRLVDFSEPLFKKLEAKQKAAKVAIKAGHRPAPPAPHFFRPARILDRPLTISLGDDKEVAARPVVPATPGASPKRT
jgi:hypothetical protein